MELIPDFLTQEPSSSTGARVAWWEWIPVLKRAGSHTTSDSSSPSSSPRPTRRRRRGRRRNRGKKRRRGYTPPTHQVAPPPGSPEREQGGQRRDKQPLQATPSSVRVDPRFLDAREWTPRSPPRISNSYHRKRKYSRRDRPPWRNRRTSTGPDHPVRRGFSPTEGQLRQSLQHALSLQTGTLPPE